MTKTTTYTFSNDFHNSSVSIRVPEGSREISKGQYKKIMKGLCGVENCTCGGIRGENIWNLDPDTYTIIQVGPKGWMDEFEHGCPREYQSYLDSHEDEICAYWADTLGFGPDKEYKEEISRRLFEEEYDKVTDAINVGDKWYTSFRSTPIYDGI